MSRWPEHTPQGRLFKAVRERDAEALRKVVKKWEYNDWESVHRSWPAVYVSIAADTPTGSWLCFWSVDTPDGAWVLSVLKEGE